MNAGSPSTTESDTSVAAYEAVRAHVLTGGVTGSHSGLLLLLRQGVAAWISRSSSFTPEPAAAPPLPMAPFTNELHAAVVRVLASMAMATQEALPA